MTGLIQSMHKILLVSEGYKMNKEKTIILICKLSVPEILPICTMSGQMAQLESCNYPKSHTD